MKKENDDYLKHFIKEYRESISVQEEGIRGKLNSILDYAIEISDNRDEFFELLSYGNYKLTQFKGRVSLKVLQSDMRFEKSIMDINKLESSLIPTKEELPIDPYKLLEEKESHAKLREEVENLPKEEKRVIEGLYFNDDYITTIMNEIGKSRDYITSLKKSAIRHIAIGLRINNEEKEEKTR